MVRQQSETESDEFRFRFDEPSTVGGRIRNGRALSVSVMTPSAPAGEKLSEFQMDASLAARKDHLLHMMGTVSTAEIAAPCRRQLLSLEHVV